MVKVKPNTEAVEWFSLIQIVSVLRTMYSGSSDGESHDAPQSQRKIPPASSMLWVRNLRRFIGSGAGLGSEALMGPSVFFVSLLHFLILLPNPNPFPLSQSLKLREFCSTFLRKSRRKPPKLLQFPLSTRRHVISCALFFFNLCPGPYVLYPFMFEL